MHIELQDIPNFSNFKVIEKINKGWSSDSKFYIETHEKEKLLLRISHISQLEAKKEEFNFIKKCNELNFQMSKAIEIGTCNNNNNVYMLLSWVEGTSLDTVINTLGDNTQYKLGLEAGKILKSIHSLKRNNTHATIYGDNTSKILSNISKYESNNIHVENDHLAIDFVKSNIHKLRSLPQVCRHGDFHVGNLILTPTGNIGVIDFNRWRYGDIYEEFYKVQSFDIEVSPLFAVGKIHGYFNGNPPSEFWGILAIYVAAYSLYSIVWAKPFGQDDVDGMVKRCINAFCDYDNFNSVIPKWYFS